MDKDKELPDKHPTSKYQCVSRPGQCKFEWCCGPLCACGIRKLAGTPQEAQDIRVAHARQARWRWRMKKKYPETHEPIKKIKLGPQHKPR